MYEVIKKNNKNSYKSNLSNLYEFLCNVGITPNQLKDYDVWYFTDKEEYLVNVSYIEYKHYFGNYKRKYVLYFDNHVEYVYATSIKEACKLLNMNEYTKYEICNIYGEVTYIHV